MSQDHNHLNHATSECKYHGMRCTAYTMSCSRQSTARSCCLGKSGGTWVVYSTSLPGARNARSRKGT
jgi:hypothetical protein